MSDAHFITLCLDLWPFDLRVNACRDPATKYTCTKLGVRSSSRFSSFGAQTHTHTYIGLPCVWTVPSVVWQSTIEITITANNRFKLTTPRVCHATIGSGAFTASATSASNSIIRLCMFGVGTQRFQIITSQVRVVPTFIRHVTCQPVTLK